MIDSGEIIPTKISNLITTQFPLFMREQGNQFTAFLKAYYTWMEEEGNSLYYSRRYYEIKDVDRSLDEFIIHFKEKYLKGIQLTTRSDTRLLVKHALDIYRSKGTERCVQLLFQLVYNEPVRFYYPSQDLFKLSDGHWEAPRYLELSLSDFNVELVNKQIFGSESKSTAFVEDIVRRITKNRFQDIAYISAINGNFITNERIHPTDDSLSYEKCPFLTGSLNEISIDGMGAGQNYEIGDLISIESEHGEGAIARVSNTSDQFGLVSFSLLDGGWGFTSNSNDVYISNIAIQIANLQTSNLSLFTYFGFGNTVTQPLALLNYRSSTGNFVEGDQLTTYYGNGSVMGTGRILEDTQANSTSGTLFVSIISGNLANTFFTPANAVTANLTASNGFTNSTATAKFIANNNSVILAVSNSSGFSVAEKINQGSASGTLTDVLGANLYVNAINGTFKSGILVYGENSGSESNVLSMATTIGLVNVNNTFTALNYNYFWANTDNNHLTGTITRIDSSGSGLSINVSNNLLLSETIHNPEELIIDFVNVAINATSYGFPSNTSANLSTVTIADCFTLNDLVIGKISKIILHGFGQDYTLPPFVVVDQTNISARNRHAPILTLVDSGVNFTVGEVITQESNGAKGTVLENSNSSILYVQSNRFNNFVPTINSTTIVVGSFSGMSANVVNVSTNAHSAVMGRNAVFESSFVEANGSITELQVVDSGFGFFEGESIDIVAQDSANAVPGIGVTNLIRQGKGTGYYLEKGGWLSDQKKLFDGDYYQNFSYEIISKLILTKYQDMLFQISHPAGTKMFGKFIHFGHSNSNLTIEKSIINVNDVN